MTLSISRLATALTVFVSLLLYGCVAGPVQPLALDPYYDTVAPQLKCQTEQLRAGGERDAVLNWEELGLAALELGDMDTARSAFDEALLRIESVFSDSETAAEARSLWYAESVKDFKGEPYERAMAFFYRGLIDIWDGDYENARAMFKSGLQQDAFAEEEQNRSDFVLHMFMIGWCAQLLGDFSAADEAYAQISEFRPDFVKPPRDHNALIILETGSSPRKYADGPELSELRFSRGARLDAQRVWVEGGTAYPMEDIYWQASTRGGRQIDKIVKGKAEFKEQQAVMGKTLTQVGLATMAAGSRHGKNDREAKGAKIAGAILTLIGLTQMAVSANVDARADVRYWDNLPDTVHIFTTHTTCETDLPITFLGGTQEPVAGTACTVHLHRAGGGFLGRASSVSAILPAH